MSSRFRLPAYCPPAFDQAPLREAPVVRSEPAPGDGILPDGFHATTNLPEYVKVSPDEWILLEESRMDAVIILGNQGPQAVEPRLVRKGDRVVIGRGENGEEGIYVHTDGFGAASSNFDKWSFHGRRTRESPYSRDYDSLYELLRWERENDGYIVWVLGPAVAFDKDSREATSSLIEAGYCQAIMAGNALATHDLEAALYGTGLGQGVYDQRRQERGHYHHLDAINRARRFPTIREGVAGMGVTDGIVAACVARGVPMVLAGSIRDDGPLPEVIADSYESQQEMRVHARRATTAIAVATQLHAIAFGNMLPSYQVRGELVRPVYFYIVDISEFALDKLANRGSMQVTGITTNAQDFMVNLGRALAP